MHYPLCSIESVKINRGLDIPAQTSIPTQTSISAQTSIPTQTSISAQTSIPTQTSIPAQTGASSQSPPLVSPIEYTGPAAPFGSSLIPIVTPEPPHFSVPGNPLLPLQYKEILSYENLQYMNGFLRTQIGKECMVVSTLGASGNVVSRIGYLIGVGINYLLLQDACSESIMVVDFYSIHLVQIMGKRCPVNLEI